MPSQDGRREALNQVLELVVLLNDDMTQRFARDGITASRAHLLWELRQRGPSTQRVLAGSLAVSPRNITGLVDALVATGFVTREPHPTDRRATLVSFTEHGEQIAAQMAADHIELAEQLFANMSDQQFDCFVHGLGTVMDALRHLLAVDHEETHV
jgi:DNA-binding MarR family transcriptional regulator